MPVQGDEQIVNSLLSAAIGARIKNARENAGLSQSELARMASVSAATQSALESGRANPTVYTLLAISHVLGCTLAELLGDAPDPMRVVVRAEHGSWSKGTAGETRFIHRFTPNGPIEVYEARWEPGEERESPPHTYGVYEHVYVLAGSLVAGNPPDTVKLRVGDYSCYPGWDVHCYRGGKHGARALIVMSYTRPALFTSGALAHGAGQARLNG